MLDSILCLRDDRWKYVRSVLTPAFSETKLKEVSYRQCCFPDLEDIIDFFCASIYLYSSILRIA